MIVNDRLRTPRDAEQLGSRVHLLLLTLCGPRQSSPAPRSISLSCFVCEKALPLRGWPKRRTLGRDSTRAHLSRPCKIVIGCIKDSYSRSVGPGASTYPVGMHLVRACAMLMGAMLLTTRKFMWRSVLICFELSSSVSAFFALALQIAVLGCNRNSTRRAFASRMPDI